MTLKMLFIQNGYILLKTPEFSRVNISQYGRGTIFKQDFVEHIGNNCCVSTNGNCPIKFFSFFSNKLYTEHV